MLTQSASQITNVSYVLYTKTTCMCRGTNTHTEIRECKLLSKKDQLSFYPDGGPVEAAVVGSSRH